MQTLSTPRLESEVQVHQGLSPSTNLDNHEQWVELKFQQKNIPTFHYIHFQSYMHLEWHLLVKQYERCVYLKIPVEGVKFNMLCLDQ